LGLEVDCIYHSGLLCGLVDNSSAMVNIPNPNGLIANVVASLPNDAGWVSIGQTYSFLTINSLDVMGEPIDSVYMHTMPAPLDNCLGAEFLRGRLVLANEIPEGTMIRFSKEGHNLNWLYLTKHCQLD